MPPTRSREESVATVFKRHCTDTGAAAPTGPGVIPPPLWELSLSSAISHLAEGDVGHLADALIKDAPLRAALQDRLLRRAQHVGDLADDDLMEIIIVSDHGILGSTLRIKTLPFRVRATLKLFFRKASSETGVDDATKRVCNFGPDGRLVFRISHLGALGVQADDWMNTYTEVLNDVVEVCKVPTKMEAGLSHIHDPLEIRDYWPHVQRDTLEYDAYELVTNRRGDDIRYELQHEMGMYFFSDSTPQFNVNVGIHTEDPKAVWVRKPRVRIVVNQDASSGDESDAGANSE